MYFTYKRQIVVEVSTARTEVASQECGVSGEDRRHGQLLQPTDKHTQTTQPLVEVSDNHWRRARKTGHKLQEREGFRE